MKISINSLTKVTVLAMACAFAASVACNAQEVVTTPASSNSGETAHLIVQRAANFGTFDSINLFVDGTEVAVIGFNRSYDALLSAGKHVLSISTNPETLPQGPPRPLEVTVEPGKTYTFTAVWRDPKRATLIVN
jgi:hypothetical protein